MLMEADLSFSSTANIKVIGVGGGGNNAVQNMIESGVRGVTFICANTDAQALERSSADIKIQLGDKLTKGLGAGANPQVGRDAALESIAAIKDAIKDAEMIFVTAGMGGGTGTGAAPVVAQAAREMGILTVGVVTRPFKYEGERRRKAADVGIAELREHVDSLIVIPNERLFTLASKKAKLSEMLKMADSVLSSAVSGISDLITCPGLINVDFADVRTAMSGTGGMAMMGMGVASGEGRALAAAKNAINCALLDDVSIAGAKSVLINITANEDLTMEEYGEANNYITECASAEGVEPQIFAGIVIDPNAGDEIRVSVIATGIESTVSENAKQQQASTPNVGHAAANHTGAAIQTPTVRASEPRVIPSRPRSAFVFDPSEDRSKPTYLRMREREQQASHNPGHEDSFVFSANEEDIELPSYFRTQAN